MNDKLFKKVITTAIFLLAGLFMGHKHWTDAHAFDSSERISKDSSVSSLMESMSIYHFTEQKKAPDFGLTSLDGERIWLNQYRGKVVLISFWTTW